MPRFTLVAVVLALVAAAPLPARAAGIDLTWSACNTDGGLQGTVFNCSDNAYVAELIGCFQLPSAMDSVFNIEVSLDIEVESAALPDFWQFDGCNASGLTLSNAEPASGCSGITNVWGAGGTGGGSTRAYLSMYGGRATRGRLVGSLFRTDLDPANVAAETNTFAFRFLISAAEASEAGGTCAGCNTAGVIVWNSAEFTSVAMSNPPPVTLTNSGLSGQCVQFNGGNAGTCTITPTRASTWGRLKALYR